MLSIKEKGLLLNIIKHCTKILEKVDGLTKQQFDDDEDVLQIVCFNILQIGELAKNFEPTFIQRFNEVPWNKIKGMRDKVAHGYGSIDVDRVWNTAIKDIKPLLDYCNLILEKEDI